VIPIAFTMLYNNIIVNSYICNYHYLSPSSPISRNHGSIKQPLTIPSPNPWRPLTYFLLPRICLFQIFHTSGLTWLFWRVDYFLLPSLSMLWYVSELCSFICLSNILLYGCTMFCFPSIHDGRLVPSIGWCKLCSGEHFKYLFESLFLILYVLGVQLLGFTIILHWTFWGDDKLFSPKPLFHR
jgi:hypothetical protein